jgi:plasmid replication initiation protein
VFNVESVNQFQLYELLKQEEQFGELIITVAELKSFLCLEEEHLNFKDFKINVLDICQEVINSKTDISFTYQIGTTEGNILSLRFIVSKNQDFESQYELEEFVNT